MADGPDYVVIGHVTRDLQPDGGVLLGGTALYAAVTATQLGRRVAVMTAGQIAGALGERLPAVLVRCQDGDRTTTFINRYHDGQRTQHVPQVAPVIDLSALPTAWAGAPVIHLGPVAQEVPPEQLGSLTPTWLCATPQGWLRAWRRDGLVELEPADAGAFAKVPRVLVLSEGDEEQNAAGLMARVRDHGGLVAVTRGARGSTLLWGDETLTIPTYPVAEVDPTGAGNVYAAALFIRLAAGDTPADAAAFASAAGALSVTGPGTNAIADEAAIRRLMRDA